MTESRTRFLWLAGLAAWFVWVLFLATPPAASAQGRGGACKNDVKTLCGDVKPGRGRILRCLHEKESQVSPACKEQMQQARAEVREKAKACKDDAAKLCKGIRPGQGRIAACLKSHEAELSPGCKAEMPNKE